MAWTKHLEKMPILRANILSGPLASIPSRPVSSTVVRKERVNFLFVWIHFHASGKSISAATHFFNGWSLTRTRLSVQGPWVCASLCLESVLYLDHILVPLGYPMLQVSCPQSGLPWPPWPPQVSHQNCPCPTELFFFFFFATVETFAKVCVRSFPSDPVVKNLPCSAGDACLIPDPETKIPYILEQPSLCTTTRESISHKEDPTQPNK